MEKETFEKEKSGILEILKNLNKESKDLENNTIEILNSLDFEKVNKKNYDIFKNAFIRIYGITGGIDGMNKYISEIKKGSIDLYKDPPEAKKWQQVIV